jgi:delta-aminolevulinic acid dehydratase/porphobilinogen synthase
MVKPGMAYLDVARMIKQKVFSLFLTETKYELVKEI